MITLNGRILTINGGSSSIKFAVYTPDEPLLCGLHGHIDRIGSPDASLTFTDPVTAQLDGCAVTAATHSASVYFQIDWREKQPGFATIRAVGHRIVPGMEHSKSERITPDLVAKLHRISPYNINHLPAELALIEAIQTRHSALNQIACFDTAFHQTLLHVAQLLTIPRRLNAQGVRRYGFYGISYTCLLAELRRIAGQGAAQGRVILAHLGSGASLAVVADHRNLLPGESARRSRRHRR